MLGIAGIILISLAAPVAWVMGGKDLKLIRAGEMDREGESMTKIGKILGIIGTVSLILQLVLIAAALIFFWEDISEMWSLLTAPAA